MNRVTTALYTIALFTMSTVLLLSVVRVAQDVHDKIMSQGDLVKSYNSLFGE